MSATSVRPGQMNASTPNMIEATPRKRSSHQFSARARTRGSCASGGLGLGRDCAVIVILVRIAAPSCETAADPTFPLIVNFLTCADRGYRDKPLAINTPPRLYRLPFLVSVFPHMDWGT